MENVKRNPEPIGEEGGQNNSSQIYALGLQIVIKMATRGGAPSINMETDLNAPLSVVMNAISTVNDSLNRMIEGKSIHEVLRMTVKDAMVLAGPQKSESDTEPTQLNAGPDPQPEQQKDAES